MSDRSSQGASRQKRVGTALRHDTKQRLIEAAASEFPVTGYSATTVTALAAAAGVSVQTLYLAWGSKRGLLRGYMENVLAGGVGSPADAAEGFDGMSPAQLLARLATVVADVAERAAPAWKVYRDAAATDPEIADDWNGLQLLRRQLFASVIGAIPVEALWDGLTVDAAIDTGWVIASPESYDLLVRRLGYDAVAFETWMRVTLTAAIMRPGAHSPA